MNAHDYMFEEDTAASQDLFESQYTSRALAYVLADEISIQSDNPARVQFLKEYEAGPSLGWFRGSLCRALASQGVSVRTINQRMS